MPASTAPTSPFFDWDRREQEVRFAHHGGDVGITEGSRLALPVGVSREIPLGVTRLPAQMPRTHPDSHAAKRLGLRTYVSVPVVLAKHELVGMVCGASRRPRPVGGPVVSVMEFFAQIVADRERSALRRRSGPASTVRVFVSPGVG